MYYDFAIMWDWLAFAVRWLHVITAIAWIGSSFYFIALDLGLRKTPDLPPGAYGEEWQVHGGGFYHVQKYLVAPDRLPDHLIWFKWEAYMTWLSGAALLMIVYWAGAELFLIDRNVADLAVWQAILISAGSLTIGWLVYDFLCKSKFIGGSMNGLMLLLFVLLVAMAWGYTQVFTGRAALLHLGAFTATIMSANVFFIIMPNQRIVVADLKAGRTPDPRYGNHCQAAVHPQQLPDIAGPVPDAIEPLPAGVRDRIQLDHRRVGVPDGCHNPPLFQHQARHRRRPYMDVAGHGIAVRDRRLAFHQSGVSNGRSGSGGLAAHRTVHAGPGLRAGQHHRSGPLRHVPRDRTHMGRHDRAAQGRRAANERTDRPLRPRNLHSGRTQPRHAAG